VSLYADVAVDVPLRSRFTYRVPPALADVLALGRRVRVPFARRETVGTVVRFPAPPPDDGVAPKDVAGVLPDAVRVDAGLLQLTRFVSDYWLCGWGEAIAAALPPDVPQRKRTAKGPPPSLPEGSSSERAVPDPTPAQASVLETLLPAARSRAYAPFLLFGATGSGKTEVYLRCAQEVLGRGRGVLYLVPEIGLTPLLVGRVASRFPNQVAVLHSGFPARARREAWEAVRDGRRRFVIGARSAVFAPLADPGLVIVDEEQDPSYKQEDVPRYNGRDLAVVLARSSDALLVLGSATPSLETFHHAKSGRYGLLRLGGRVQDRPLPAVERIDMRKEFATTGRAAPISRALGAALTETLGRGEQALILRNRRGWAPALLCTACGQRVHCTRCSVAMTWHRSAGRLRCHACGKELPFPTACPACREPALREIGEGTERIEDDLRRLLPGARIERMDRDTVKRRGSQAALLERFDAGEIDVLVGTQMIAKGHDFPRVTLVGVLSADQTLGLPDFRASERTFQLLTQVAGRAGRGDRPGRVLVQAFDPDHPVLREAAVQDFEAFYEREIAYRRALRVPPLSALVQILVLDRDELKAAKWSERVADAIRSEGEGRLRVSGPGPAPMERIRDRWRRQVLVRSAGRRRMVEAIDRALASLAREIPRRAIHVDVDPVSLL
jgi:primosomal protein N' (replication factor Y)